VRKEVLMAKTGTLKAARQREAQSAKDTTHAAGTYVKIMTGQQDRKDKGKGKKYGR
jgi:hypothetical protein